LSENTAIRSNWGEISDDTIANAAELLGTELRRDRFRWITEANRDAIQHWTEGIGDRNPLFRDPNYGVNTRWGTMLAPPTVLFAFENTVVAPRLPGVQWIMAGVDWIFYDVVRVGDEIVPVTWYHDQKEKSGDFTNRWLLQTGLSHYTRKSDGVLVAEARGHTARMPRGSALKKQGKPKYEPRGEHLYTPAEIDDIEAQVLAEKPRGAETRFWEDVSVGESLGSIVRGPLTSTDMIAFYAGAIGARTYGGAHGDAVHYRASHQDFHLSETTGARDTPGRGHLEADTGRDVGMGGAYDSGIQRVSWGASLLTDWIGDDGFLHKYAASLRRPNLLGDTTWWSGEVTSVTDRKEYGEVEIEVNAKNQFDHVTAVAKATVLLPTRSGGEILLPLKPA
jgi:acyl dehydratase